MDVLNANEMQSLINKHGDSIKSYTAFAGLMPCGGVTVNAQDSFAKDGFDHLYRSGGVTKCHLYKALSGGYILIPVSLV